MDIKCVVLPDSFTSIGYIVKSIVFPLVVAILGYIAVNRLGEWKDRKNTSILGIAIIDTLIEEVQTGLRIYKETYERATAAGPIPTGPIATGIPPKSSWDNGMNTIPDKVLLRIIAASRNVEPASFPLVQIRSHCKNYFDIITTNFELAAQDQFSRERLKSVLDPSIEHGLMKGTENVLKMLNQAKDVLADNSKKCFPD